MKSKTKSASFDELFLDSYAGHAIINDPKVAIVELVANSWDAGATKVNIAVPLDNGDRFSVRDNGHGMTERMFAERFMKLGYRRQLIQGNHAEIPTDHSEIAVRPAFGRNAKGKCAAFHFGNKFYVRSWRDGVECTFEVLRSTKSVLEYRLLEESSRAGHGTEVYVERARAFELTEDATRMEIGMRFLTDPHFEVFVNGKKVQFTDIREEFLKISEFEIDNFGPVKITVIDANTTDRTMHLHGIAWWVAGRLVGECSWKGTEYQESFDGRRTHSRRYTFIVEANGLKDAGAVLPDWTGFNPKNDAYKLVAREVSDRVREHMYELTKEFREEQFEQIEQNNGNLLKKMPLVGREKWEDFVKEVQKECPSIGDSDLDRVASILAKLETTKSKYGLIEQLSLMDVDDLEDLNTLLDKWNIDFAKIVLDELEVRFRLLERLKIRVKNPSTDEVHDLQPLFERGLWIFGPEYETIEYTSNEGMTSVIQKIFGANSLGSRNRPDFAVVPDGSVGFYSYPMFDDEDGAEVGVKQLTIVELKKPGVPIADAEKRQPIKYVNELDDKGLLLPRTNITCFVLGESVDKFYVGKSTDQDGRIVTWALPFDTVIARAESRLHHLYKKISNAPFLRDTRVEEYLTERSQIEIPMY